MTGTGTASRGRRNEKSADSRYRILEATIDLAAEVGYDGTTMAKVVKATGLPASSIYWHFGNKEKLIAAALRHSFDVLRVGHPVWPPPTESDDLAAEITRAVRAGLSADREDRYLRLGLMLSIERRHGAARKEFDAIRELAWANLADWWAGLLTANGWSGQSAAPETMTRLMLSSLDGFWAAQHVMPPSVDVVHSLVLMLAGQARHLIEHPDDVVTSRDEPLIIPSSHHVPEGLSGRDRLLVAAEQIVTENGISSTVAKICERAGLPASSLYWFFTNREELVGQVVANGYRRFVEAAGWAPLTAADLENNEWLHQGLRASAAEADIFRIGHMLLLRRQEDAAQRAFIKIRHEFADSRIEWFTTYLGLDRERSAELAWAMVVVSDGALMGWTADARRPLVDVADLLAVGLRAALLDGGVHVANTPRVGDE